MFVPHIFPNRSDWFRNYWRASADLDVARDAVMILNRPREAYVNNLRELRNARLERRMTPLIFVALAGLGGVFQVIGVVQEHMTTGIIWSFMDVAGLFGSFGVVGMRLDATRKLKVNSESLMLMRKLHPDKRAQFATLEEFYNTKPAAPQFLDYVSIERRVGRLTALKGSFEKVKHD